MCQALHFVLFVSVISFTPRCPVSGSSSKNQYRADSLSCRSLRKAGVQSRLEVGNKGAVGDGFRSFNTKAAAGALAILG